MGLEGGLRAVMPPVIKEFTFFMIHAAIAVMAHISTMVFENGKEKISTYSAYSIILSIVFPEALPASIEEQRPQPYSQNK